VLTRLQNQPRPKRALAECHTHARSRTFAFTMKGICAQAANTPGSNASMDVRVSPQAIGEKSLK